MSESAAGTGQQVTRTDLSLTLLLPALYCVFVCRGAVYRISFALFVFFLLHALLLLFTAFARLDRVRWWWHYLLYIGLLVACFAIPSPFYDDGWVNIARFVSAFFLFFQIVILIDFAYEWNESWTSDEKGWFAPLLAVSAVMLAGCVALWVLYFIWFGGSGCPRNNFLVAWTVIQCVIATALAVSPLAEGNGGILPAAVLSLYMTWLAYSGLESDPSGCNGISSQDTLHLILGLIIGALSLVYAAWNVSTNNTLFGGEEEIPANEAAANGDVEMAQHTAAANGANTTTTDTTTTNTTIDNTTPSAVSPSLSADADSARHLARRNFRLHVLMCLASAYMAMLLTNWGSSQQARDSESGSHSQQSYDQGTESLFIKFATQWLTFFTFVWALIAPKVLTNREFRIR